jgi:predicted anti-sigma-YlaC factor YlaD
VVQNACQEFWLLAASYLEEEPTAELRARLEGHLSGCAECRIWFDTFQKTISLFHELPRPELPAEARERLYKSLALDEYITRERNSS